jgi:predicted amidohydrolase
MIIDPWGRIVSQLGGEGPGIAIADIDLAAVDEARGKVPALANARPFSLTLGRSGTDPTAREDVSA